MKRVVRRPAKLAGVVTPPGDKSISHRSLMLNSMAAGEAHVSGLGRGEDVVSTMRCMEKLGATFEETGSPGSVRIRGLGPALNEPEDILDTGNSGTSMRLLGGLVAGQSFLTVLTGDASLRSRPMGRIVQPLQTMGARISGRNGDTLAPLAISGGDLKGIEYTMPVASAQVKSALLLAGLSASAPTVLHQPALSRDHTERMLRAMGATIEEDGLTITLHPASLHPVDVTVPSDISSAAFWLVAACCHPDADVTVAGVGINPSRTGILEALEAMGADITLENQREEGGEPVADLHARSCQLHGTEIGGDLIPRLIDEIPVLAVAACFADSPTIIRNAEELRVKESDRLAATVHVLSRLGARVEEQPDGMVVHGGGRLIGATVSSQGDHRLAMAMAAAGLVSDGEVRGGASRIRLRLLSLLLGALGLPDGRRPPLGPMASPPPLLVIISGPSGVGKDAVVHGLKQLGHPWHFPLTATTRPPRGSEVDGVDYIFMTQTQFADLLAQDELPGTCRSLRTPLRGAATAGIGSPQPRGNSRAESRRPRHGHHQGGWRPKRSPS